MFQNIIIKIQICFLKNQNQNSTNMITENEMYEGEDFILGVDNIHKNSNFLHTFNPDTAKNFHLMISGTSGSGKSRILKKFIKYLQKKNKHIHVIDIKGDLFIEGENYIDFPIRNQEYGINPFEFDRNIETGGIKRRSTEIVDMIVKAFELKIGAAKKDIISKLIIDTYRSKGITENESTWDLTANKQAQAQKLPGIEDLKNLTETIIDAVSYGQTEKLDLIMKKNARKAIFASSKINKINSVRTNVLETLKDKYYTIVSDLYNKQTINVEPSNKNQTFDEIINLKIKGDKDYKKIQEMDFDIKNEEKIIQKYREEFINTANYMFNKYISSQGVDNSSFSSFVTNDEELKGVDLKYYSKKSVINMLEDISVYISMLSNSGLFNKNIPPVKPGLNRYDISKHNQATQIFFTEVIAFKLFNVTKLRGDYSKLPQHIRDKRGQHNDTFLIVDEAQVVLPDINSKDKESSSQVINRIAAESRSNGLGLVLSSQSMNKFSNVVNVNIPNKIIFKTLGVDVNLAKKLIGINISDKKNKTFEMLNSNFGVGLYIDEAQNKNIFLTPWYNNKKKRVFYD